MELRDLQKMTVVKLREEALKLGGITGVHGMNKQELLEALAPRFGIDLEAAKRASQARFSGDKTAMKREIRRLKAERDAALQAHDLAALTHARTSIKKYKRTLRRLAKQA